MQDSPEKRTCGKCRERLPLDAFSSGSTSWCKACYSARNRARYRERASAGICVTFGCDQPSDGKRLCAVCREKKRLADVARAEAGRCKYCGSPVMTKNCCRRCWFRCLAFRYLGSMDLGHEMERLWDAQGGRCDLTGRVLIEGVDASIDHRVPRSRGGADELSNYRFVSKAANMARSNLSDEAFVQLCRDVIAHADR